MREPEIHPEKDIAQDVFLKESGWGWRVSYLSDASEEGPGVLRVQRDGIIFLEGGDESWNFDQPRVRELYGSALAILQRQGVEVRPPEPSFPHAEERIRAAATPQQEIPVSELAQHEGKQVLILSNPTHPETKEGNTIGFIGKLERVTHRLPKDSSREEDVILRFEHRMTEGPYSYPQPTGWELMFSHVNPTTSRISHVHYGDIGEVWNRKEKGVWKYRVYLVNDEWCKAVTDEIGTSAHRRRPIGRRDGAHSITEGAMVVLELLEFYDALRHAGTSRRDALPESGNVHPADRSV